MGRNSPTFYRFEEVARLAEPGDNVAIAVRRLEAGSKLQYGSQELHLAHTLLEGHRFAVQPVARGAALLSWGLPFGFALCDIQPGGYVINAGTLEALRLRAIDFLLPTVPNFEDRIPVYHLDEALFLPSAPLEKSEGGSFLGYVRPGGRGTGTRNYIVLLALSSSANGYVRMLEMRLKAALLPEDNLDGAVAVAHTEGSLPDAAGREQLLRTLAGWVVHPNVASVLLVEHPADDLTADDLYAWMAAHEFPLQDVPHALLRLGSDFEGDLQRGAEQVHALTAVCCQEQRRTQQPLSGLKLALQCGGSDAFSGISGNPMAALAARKLILHGGSALLAETPELVGAEAYLLQRVRNLDVARRFLAVQARYRERVAAYGVTVEDNPGGGNRFRGLYNITLKSIGAARKRHPDVPLDGVLEYAQRLPGGGYYFMDSPGNDLESIAGQVAAGCNLVLFVTGNGSVTNFPFVPTIKVVTTTGRYNLMPDEMDLNAGRYLDGETMDALGEEAFRLVCEVVEGRRTVGEQAGHAQVQLWRALPKLERLNGEEEAGAVGEMPAGFSSGCAGRQKKELRIAMNVNKNTCGYAHEQVGLILPASMCSAQAARLIAGQMMRKGVGSGAGLTRYVALMHTEGCGSSPNTDELLVRTLAGYLRNPLVRLALVVEHGCERTLNDMLKRGFADYGIDPASLGWASVQMDGGLQGALKQAEAWFSAQTAGMAPLERFSAGWEALRLGILLDDTVSDTLLCALDGLIASATDAGGMVVVMQPGRTRCHSMKYETIDFAGYPYEHGLYIMRTPTRQRTEMLVGLGAAGVNVILAAGSRTPLPGHPLVPVIQIAEGEAAGMDLLLTGDELRWSEQMTEQIAAVLEGRYTPLALYQGNVDFQLTRAERGVSL